MLASFLSLFGISAVQRCPGALAGSELSEAGRNSGQLGSSYLPMNIVTHR